MIYGKVACFYSLLYSENVDELTNLSCCRKNCTRAFSTKRYLIFYYAYCTPKNFELLLHGFPCIYLFSVLAFKLLWPHKPVLNSNQHKKSALADKSSKIGLADEEQLLYFPHPLHPLSLDKTKKPHNIATNME